MYIAYAPPPPLSRPRQILFLGDAPLPAQQKRTPPQKGGVLCFLGASRPLAANMLQSIEISAILEVHGIPCGSLPRNGTSRLLRNLQGEQLAIGAIAFSPRRKTAVLWRLALPRKSGLPVYIAPYGEPCRREGNFMSDFELLSIVLMFLGILVTVIVAYIQDTKK